jgi:hypothetical protein
MNTVAQTVEQYCMDFLSIIHIDLHYILCHFHFHLQPTCPAALVLADLERVKQAVQLMVNLVSDPYV